MTRMSALGTAERCGASPRIGAERGAGTAAAMGRAGHAIAEGSPEASKLLAVLSPDDQREVESWHVPHGVEVSGHHLQYSDAVKEAEVGLNSVGGYCEAGDPDIISLGHLDMAWVFGDMAIVGDIKRSSFTVADGPDSLQLQAYGTAWALKHGCSHYVTGIWSASDGEWMWQREPIELASFEHADIWARIYHAATNDGEAIVGSHCSGCYQRLHCPERPQIGQLLGDELAGLASAEMNDEQALTALSLLARLEPLMKEVKSTLRVYAHRTGGIPDPSVNKVWKAIKTRGRESCSVKSLREAMGDEEASKYITRGRGGEQFRWLKA